MYIILYFISFILIECLLANWDHVEIFVFALFPTCIAIVSLKFLSVRNNLKSRLLVSSSDFSGSCWNLCQFLLYLYCNCSNA